MTLQEISQILADIGVIVSVTFVAFQIRNNARLLKASANRDLAGGMVSNWTTLATNAELTRVLLDGGEDYGGLGRDEQARFRFMLIAYLRQFGHALYQKRLGLLNDLDRMTLISDIELIFAWPGARMAFSQIKARFDPELVAFVEAIIARAEKRTES
jgi:hypothetical protein